MNTRGAVDLAPLKAKNEVGLELGRFHDPALAHLAEIAADLNATMYEGGWVQLVNYAFPEQGSTVVAKNNYTPIADIVNAQRPFIPANTLRVGTHLRVEAWGTLGSAAGTATATMGLYLNGAATGTQMCVSANFTPPTSTVNVWHARFKMTVITIGSAGTIQTAGYGIGLGATASTPVIIPATLPAAATINTTIANSITLAVGWGTANGSNTFSVYGFTVEQLN